MDQKTANAITEYKTRERRTRALLANGLNVLLEAKRCRAELAISVNASGIPELIEFYNSQLTINDPKNMKGATVAYFDAIENIIDQIYAIVCTMNAAAGSDIFPGVPVVKV